MAALEWLYWKEKELNHQNLTPKIAYTGNRGERRIQHGAIHNYLIGGYDEQSQVAKLMLN